MRRYETIFIADPDLSEENREQIFDKIKDLISKFNGFLVMFDQWGAKKLAYQIKKKNRGYYVRVDFCGDGALVDEIERSFRIDDKVLKFMTIVLDKDADPEKIKAELAEKKAAEAKAAAEAAPAAADVSSSDQAENSESASDQVKNDENDQEPKTDGEN